LPPTGRPNQFFCGDFLHDLDLEITLGNQPRILGLELLQAPDVVRPKATPCVLPNAFNQRASR
jgi:hypothetical protein